jgi:hypothetical protein
LISPVGLSEQAEPARVLHAGHGCDFIFDGLRQAFQLRKVAAENLDRILAFNTGQCLLDVVLDVLGEVEVYTDELAVELLVHLTDELVFREPARPLVEGLQNHEIFGDEGAVGIGRVLAAPLFRDDGAHRRVAQQDLTHARDGFDPRGQRDGGGEQRTHPHVAFLEFRQELRAETRSNCAAEHQEGEADQRGDLGVAHREMEQARIDAPYQPHDERLDLCDAIGQDKRRQHRRDGEGGDDGTQQRVGIRARHGAEDLPLNALHGEQRQKRCDGDDDREEDGSVHLHGSREDGVELGRQSAVGDGGRLT